jgi:hypothetical protein
LILSPSAHQYSYFGPADITVQEASVQHSLTLPYNKLISLKKSTAIGTKEEQGEVRTQKTIENKRDKLFTASHSLRSASGGNCTAAFKFLICTAFARLWSSYPFAPLAIFLGFCVFI